jgi:endonuclease/exonuclease/phosphatase family metal-dependent hydrolase
MRRRQRLMVILAAGLLVVPALRGHSDPAPRLRILTINTWSGLDYQGFARFGEYEPEARREMRFAVLVGQIKTLNPDVIFIQEANFAGRYARRLADALGFTEIHQVVNGGIKLGPLGLPSNLKEGMAILARPALNLRRQDIWKLSGPFGFYGDFLTVHFSEAIFSLVGKVILNDTPLYLVNVHLVASAPRDELLFSRFREMPEVRDLPEAEIAQALTDTAAKNARRIDEVRALVKALKGLPQGAPAVIAGDFNTDRESLAIREFIASSGALDTMALRGERNAMTGRKLLFTWDPGLNENIAYSSRPVDASGRKRSALGLLDALDSGIGRRIDYIFLNPGFREEDILDSAVVLDAAEDGIHASDHFGVSAEISLERLCRTSPQEPRTVVPPKTFSQEFFPILMWDTDIEFGYGLKSFSLNPFGLSESFDLTAFNSSKGERWYRFVFSLPDFETRQGKIFPLAFDLAIDYDKMIRNSFFGIGNLSRFEDREYYTREPVEIGLTLSRGFTPRLVGQLGLKYATVKNLGFAPDSRLQALPPEANAGGASSFSFLATFRYDSRDSFIQPSEGIVLQTEGEYAPKMGGTSVRFGRLAAWFQYYTVLFYPKTVFALRIGGQNLFGEDLPIQMLLRLGGNKTLRGSPQDRYLDKSYLLMNAELRLPLVRQLGAVLGMDLGRVWPSLGDFDLRGWVANPVIGLRFAMRTFIVRMDVGLGRDATGLYFNFGHLF